MGIFFEVAFSGFQCVSGSSSRSEEGSWESDNGVELVYGSTLARLIADRILRTYV